MKFKKKFNTGFDSNVKCCCEESENQDDLGKTGEEVCFYSEVSDEEKKPDEKDDDFY